MGDVEIGVGYPPLASIAGSECPSLSQREGGGRDGGRRQAIAHNAQPSRAHFPPPSGGRYCSWRVKFPAPRATNSS